ncbi:hypothetical protein UFOVP185_24 [uncultured Caudovirales phage]|uniref:Uncharacterized protein n=1 Tax=uncultured Caudovirales phage TaxID=2100421 RepID=A0A6J7WJV2_9CAUD|nr:hypothetical protein UFOVP185_24 [uncultured Caudovirales phage]
MNRRERRFVARNQKKLQKILMEELKKLQKNNIKEIPQDMDKKIPEPFGNLK